MDPLDDCSSEFLMVCGIGCLGLDIESNSCPCRRFRHGGCVWESLLCSGSTCKLCCLCYPVQCLPCCYRRSTNEAIVVHLLSQGLCRLVSKLQALPIAGRGTPACDSACSGAQATASICARARVSMHACVFGGWWTLWVVRGWAWHRVCSGNGSIELLDWH